MLKNLKIDIIYYNTPSDFEFEFNLGGYCRSRILNAKASDLKEALTKLAIAVSRSRVIIIIGEMLGNNGCIAPVAKAISKPLVAVDHRQYHITSPEPINIIEGSLPLVSSNGEFGGCIIESGPQSIVFLSENKQIRNSIEKELLSHYLTSLSMTSDEENEIINETETVNEPEETDQTSEPQVETLEETTEEEEIISENAEIEIPADETQDSEIITETVTKDIDIFSNETIEDIKEVNENAIELPDSEIETNEEDFTEETVSKPEITEEDEKEISSREEILFITPEKSSPVINAFDNFDNEIESNDYEEEVVKEKKPRKPLSSLSKVLIALFAVLFIVIAAILYFTVYLPSLDGVSFFEFIDRVFAFTKLL